MSDIRVVVSGKGELVFPDGTSDAAIQEAVQREFPRDGSDVVGDLAADPSFAKKMSTDDFQRYEQFMEDRKVDFINTAAGAAAYLGNTVLNGIRGLFELDNLNPAKAGGTAVESVAQGTRNLYGMLAQSEDPGSIFFKFKDWINGTGTPEDRKQQWIEARDFAERTQRLEAGQATVSGIDPSLVNNDVKNLLMQIADPTMLVPGVGEALGAGRLATRAVGAGLEAAGKGAQLATRPLVGAIEKGTQLAADALGAESKTLRGIAAGTGVSGAVMGLPGAAAAVGAVAGVEGADIAARVLERAGQQLSNAPTRIGALESLALNPNAGVIEKALAKVGRYGADNILDIGLRGTVGATEGAAIGGALGYLSGGEEGAAAGLGSGAVLGGTGATLARGYQKVSGKAAAEARAADFGRFYESLDDANKTRWDSIVKNSGVDGAVRVMDIAGHLAGQLGDAELRVLTGPEFQSQFKKNGRGVQFVEGDRPVVYIDADRFTSDATAGHELAHAYDAIEQLRPQADKIRQYIAGTYVIDGNGNSVLATPGLIPETEVLRRFDDYIKDLKPAPDDDWSKANTTYEKAQLVSHELMSEYMDKLIRGSGPDAMLRGFDGITRGLLDRALTDSADGTIRRIAQKFGLGSQPIESITFKDLPQATPVLNAMLRDLVRARRTLSERISLADDTGLVISRRDLSNPVAAEEAIKMGLAERKADGTVAWRPEDKLNAEDHAQNAEIQRIVQNTPVADSTKPHMRVVDGAIKGDGISPQQLAAIVASPTLPNKIKEAYRVLAKAFEDGDVLFIRNGKATKEITSRLTGKKLKRYNDGVRLVDLEGRIYELATNKAGEPFVRTINVSKLRGYAMDLAARNKLGPWGADFKSFYQDFVTYLSNVGDPSSNLRTKELPGFTPEKALYMNEFFGGKDGTAAKFIRNFTLDRMVEMRPTGEKMSLSDGAVAWNRQKQKWQPAEKIGDGQVINSPDGYRIIYNGKDWQLYSPEGKRLGIYETQAKAEARASSQATPTEGKATISDGFVTAPESGLFRLTQDITKHFQPASDKVKLEDYHDRPVIALAADRMGIGPAEVGPLSNRRVTTVASQGGRGFIKIFNGGGWSFSDEATALRFLQRVGQVADTNGNAVAAVTVLSPINHLKNAAGQSAYVDAINAAIEGQLIRRKDANAHIKAMAESIVASKAQSISQNTRDKFANISDLSSFEAAVRARQINFADASPLLDQMQRKKLPITDKAAREMNIAPDQIARDLADPELADVPFGTVVALFEVNVNQKPDKNNFHYAYPYAVHGKTIGFLDKFYNLADLTSDKRILQNGRVSAQPVQTVMPILDNIRATVETGKGFASDPAQRGVAKFQPAAPDTPEFKKWFGESKAVDESGKPLVVYHGAVSDFNVFDPNAVKGRDPKWGAIGSWFSESPKYAKLWTGSFDEKGARTEGPVKSVFLSIQEPAVYAKEKNRIADPFEVLMSDYRRITGVKTNQATKETNKKFVDYLKQSGYDGIIVKRTFADSLFDPDPQNFYVAFDPHQIKSATDNSGQFDATNPDIRFQPPENLPHGKVWRGENGFSIVQKDGGNYRTYSPLGLLGVSSTIEKAKQLIQTRLK